MNQSVKIIKKPENNTTTTKIISSEMEEQLLCIKKQLTKNINTFFEEQKTLTKFFEEQLKTNLDKLLNNIKNNKTLLEYNYNSIINNSINNNSINNNNVKNPVKYNNINNININNVIESAKEDAQEDKKPSVCFVVETLC